MSEEEVAGEQPIEEVSAAEPGDSLSEAPASSPAHAAEVGGAPPEAEPGDRELEIAENDAAVQRELRRRSRRGFITLGAGTVAAYGAWKWLRLRPRDGGVEWPLRRAFVFNEKVSEAYFRT